MIRSFPFICQCSNIKYVNLTVDDSRKNGFEIYSGPKTLFTKSDAYNENYYQCMIIVKYETFIHIILTMGFFF